MTDPVLEIPFVGGIDELSRDESAQPGASWSVLENVRQNETGAAEKRLGYTSLATTRLTGSARASGLRVFSNGDQVCTIDSTPELDVYSTSLARSVVRGRVPEASVRLREVPSPAPASLLASATEGDTATISGGDGGVYVALAYVVKDSAGTNYANVSLLDADNGAVVLSPRNLEAATMVTLATYSTFVLAFIALSTNLKLYKLDVTSAASIAAGWSLVGTLATDYDSSNAYVHAVTLPSNGGCAIAYKNNSGGASALTVRTADQWGNLAATTITAATAQLTVTGLSEGGSVLWVAWNQGSAIRAASIDESSLAIVSAAAQVLTGGLPQVIFVAPRASGAAAVYVTDQTVGAAMVAIQNSAGTTAAAGSVATLSSTWVLSRPFLYASRIYAHCGTRSISEMILCDVTPDTTSASNLVTYFRPVAAPIQRELFNTSGYRTAAIPNTTRFVHGFSVKRSGTTVGAALAEYDFASSYRWRPAVLNGSTFLSGGVLSVFDGTRVSEAAFLVRPGQATISSVASAGAVSLSTGRRYVLTYTEVDADGNLHVSGVSDPSNSTGAIASKRVDLTFVPITITSRGFTTSAIAAETLTSSLRVEVWGTLDGGSTYYRVGDVTNNPNSATLSFSDNTTDAILATRPLLYGTGALPGTGGSSQDHRAPPGLTHIVSYNGMLVGAQGSTIYFSSQLIDGEGTWFSPAFTRAVDEDITGLAVQDGSVLIFTLTGVWVASGEPPSDNALQGGLSTPRKLAIDQGCTNANSLLTTSVGTFFQSARGLELLTRGHTLTPIGDKVQDTLAAYPVVTSAVLDARGGLARFALAESMTDGVASASGRDLVFDMTTGAWVSSDVKRGTSAGQASQDAMMAYIAGSWRYAWLATDGVVYYERDDSDGSAYLDGSTWVTQKAETPWVHIAGLQGEQFIDQVLLLAKKVTGHNLTVSLAFDYVDSYTSVKTFTAAQIAALGRQWLVKEVGSRSTSTAIRVKLEDATPSSGSVGTGAGAAWVALTLNGVPHRGPKRSTSAERGGT